MDYDKLIERLKKSADFEDYPVVASFAAIIEKKYLREAATALSTLQAENEKLRAENIRWGQVASEQDKQLDKLQAELKQVKRERDAAVEAVKNMAEYIVCAGRVDYYLCDEISQEHHLKYQPKNDGNYDNEPCYKCIADWFLQGHEWQENC